MEACVLCAFNASNDKMDTYAYFAKNIRYVYREFLDKYNFMASINHAPNGLKNDRNTL